VGVTTDRLGLNQISREKDQRRYELLVIDRRKQKLVEWRKRLEQRESNLKDRESRVFEAEPFLSVAKQLQNLGIGMEETLPWIEILWEKAEAENVDLLNRGVTESQIVQLINFAGEWNKYWQSSTTNGNFQQPVNGSNSG